MGLLKSGIKDSGVMVRGVEDNQGVGPVGEIGGSSVEDMSMTS